MSEPSAVEPSAVEPIRAVIFDFHSTLFSPGRPDAWLAEALTRLGRTAEHDELLRTHPDLHERLHNIWEYAAEVDPDSTRDRSPEQHRTVYDATIAGFAGVDDELADALYATMADQWVPYFEVPGLLRRLRAGGVAVGLLSNIGVDLADCLERGGIADLLDVVVLSYQVGYVKPDPWIFSLTCERLGVRPEHTLMVGDSWRADAGAADVGIRTLILPREPATADSHGLQIVEALVSA